MSCPICQKEGTQKYRPFCSKRCADIDLAKWMNGAYAVPSEREYDPEELVKALDELTEEEKSNTAQKPH